MVTIDSLFAATIRAIAATSGSTSGLFHRHARTSAPVATTHLHLSTLLS
jgi:hypothetical protein